MTIEDKFRQRSERLKLQLSVTQENWLSSRLL